MTRFRDGVKWWTIAGLALLVGVASALAIPLFVSMDHYRLLLIQLIDESTGRRLEIDHLQLHVFPTPHLEAANVRLRNPPGFPRGDAVVIKTLRLRVALGKLLLGKLDVIYIEASGVQVNLLSTPDGQSNFSLPKSESGEGGHVMAAAQYHPPMVSLERVRAVRATDVGVTIGDVDPGEGRLTPYLVVGGLNGRAWSFTPLSPDWRRKLGIALDLRHATLTTAAFTKPVLFRAGELLVTRGRGHGTFAASLDTTQFRGTFRVAHFTPFSLTFALATPLLDMVRLGRVVTLRAGPTRSRQPRLIAHGTVMVDRVVAGALAAAGARGSLSFYTNRMRVDTYLLSAYGGTVEGTGSLNYSATSLPASVTVRAHGVALQQMVRTIAPHAGGVLGTLDANLKLTMSLARDPRMTLAGLGAFAVHNGSFPSVELHRKAVTMARLFQVTVPGNSIPFTYLGGNLRIAQQHVRSNALRLDGHGLHATAQGSIGFDRALLLTGIGVLDTEASPPPTSGVLVRALGWVVRHVVPGAKNASGVQVQFVVGGTLDDPTFSVIGTPKFVHGQIRGSMGPAGRALPHCDNETCLLAN